VRPRRRISASQLDENWQPRLYVRLIVLVLLFAYAIAFVLENKKSVDVHFVFVKASVSLIWLILLALALGLVGGILLGQLERRRRRRSKQRGEAADTLGDLPRRDEAEGEAERP
jgi:uncharacterized integral membrane protein